MVNNGLVTWLPTLYRQVFKLPLDTSLLYGWITSAVGVVASLLCALYIDKVGRKHWYAAAFFLATVPLVVLTALGATTATQVVILAPIAYAILQTVAFSLYLYSAELYPTRLRAMAPASAAPGSAPAPPSAPSWSASSSPASGSATSSWPSPPSPSSADSSSPGSGSKPRARSSKNSRPDRHPLQPAAGLCPRPVLACHEVGQPLPQWGHLRRPPDARAMLRR